MEITGKIKKVLTAVSGVSQSTGNTWMSQDYLLEYFWWPNQTHASIMLFRVFGEDRIKQFNLQENDEVKLNYYIDAHEYNGRWFNQVQATSCTKIGASAQQPTQAPAADQNAQPAPQPEQPDATGENPDDLPF